jgi:hypothetical protein
MMKRVMTVVLVMAGYAWATGTGTVDLVSGWYPAGTNLTVTATPMNLYSRFDHWIHDFPSNDVSVVSTQISLWVVSPGSVTAHFVDAVTASNAVPYAWLHTLSNDWTTIEAFESAVMNDYDGDGFTTAEEYWSGTDPFSAASYLHISSVALSGGNVQLSWYHDRVDSNIPPLRVQVRTNLFYGNWQNAEANTNVPVSGLNSWETLHTGSRFYRLIVPGMGD